MALLSRIASLRSLPVLLSSAIAACASQQAPAAASVEPEPVISRPSAAPTATSAPAGPSLFTSEGACGPARPTLPAPPQGPPPVPALDANAPPALRRACETRRAAVERAARGRGSELTARLGVCVPAGRGAWVLRLDSIERDADAPSLTELFRARATLVLLDESGREVAHGEPVSVSNTSGAHAGCAEHSGVSIVHAFDYDGDGTSEVLTLSEERCNEDSTQHWGLYAARDGRVVRYARAPERFAAPADVDGDGRVDLYVPSPVHSEYTCGLDGATRSGPPLLAHSERDGSFSLTAGASIAALARACGARVDAAARLVVRDGADTMRNVACALHYGADPEALRARIGREYPTRIESASERESDDRCWSLDGLLAAAGAQVPVRIGRECP